ncbi:MAG: hypothetical protein E7214_08935 [Clostridium sp.]|nr:hypothetical protein [Clostridium sp.]
MKLKKILIALSLAVATSVSVVGCGNSAGESADSGDESAKNDLAKSDVVTYDAKDLSSNPSTATNRKDTLIIGQSAPEGKFNPCFMETAYDFSISGAMHDGLFNNLADGSLEKNLLEDYKISDDGLTYTFKLKKDLKWSDNTPLTTKDIEMFFKVICDASYDGVSDVITGKAKVEGAKEYQEGKATSISGLKIVDDQTIEIKLIEASSSAIYELAIAPVPAHYYEKYYKQGDETELKKHISTSPEMPVCGQYKLVSYEEGVETKLVANENHAAGVAKIKNLIFKVDTKENQIPLLQSGEIDFDADIDANPDNATELENAGFLGYKYYPTNGYGYIGFNHKNPALKDKAVRQALATGLNRAKITNTVFDKFGKVINVPQSQVCWAYAEGKNSYDYDLEKAKKMLDDAGWKEGADGIREKDGQKLKFMFTGAQESAITNPLIAVADNDWKQLGIDFQTEIVDFNTLKQKQNKGDFEAFFMAWGLTPDPNDQNVYGTGGSQNRVNYSNPKVDELYDKISKEMNQDKQKELYKELYTELNEDLPCIFVYQRSDLVGYNGRVKGIIASPYEHYYDNIYKMTLEDK